MPAPRPVVNLDDKFASFEDRWSPKIIAKMNDLDVKIVKLEGEFVWHSHVDTDELFLVHRGELTIQLRGREDVILRPGEIFVVPRGMEHRPVAAVECEALLIEPAGVVNTGAAGAGDRTTMPEWI
ncbi:MAG TPA: cupin domain-containing protein [Acidimicrobiia bacterium]|nr:cupin domain-containing protein [Acidimicrobiia bacterium]